VTLLRERSPIALPRLAGEGMSADAAFVDGSHVFHNVVVDLYYLQMIIRPGGLVVLDDYWWPGVATAARYFETNLGWSAACARERHAGTITCAAVARSAGGAGISRS
jgi:predicted O-methyltransferase YrrM